MTVKRLLQKFDNSLVETLEISKSSPAEDVISFQNLLESDFATILEFDPNVRFYERNPFSIKFNEEGKLKRFTPSFLVKYKNSSEHPSCSRPMVFVLTQRKYLHTNWKELKPKYFEVLKFAASKDWRFKILTEKEIRLPYLENAKFLLRYKNAKVDRSLITNNLDTLKSLRVSFPEELIKVGAIDWKRRGELLYSLWYMIANGMIGCDLTCSLNMRSEIWIKEPDTII